VTGTNAVCADKAYYGKYFYSLDSTQFIELKPNGSFKFATRVHHPDGKFGKDLKYVTGPYEVKGDIVILMFNEIDGEKIHDKSDLKIEGNTLVPTRKMRGKFKGAKFMKK